MKPRADETGVTVATQKELMLSKTNLEKIIKILMLKINKMFQTRPKVVRECGSFAHSIHVKQTIWEIKLDFHNKLS